MPLTQKIPGRSGANQHKAVLLGRPSCGIPTIFHWRPCFSLWPRQ